MFVLLLHLQYLYICVCGDIMKRTAVVWVQYRLHPGYTVAHARSPNTHLAPCYAVIETCTVVTQNTMLSLQDYKAK